MRHGFKSIAGSAGDDRRREREREEKRGTRASNQDELLTTGRGGGKRDPRPSVCRPWDAFVSCKKRAGGVEGRREEECEYSMLSHMSSYQMQLQSVPGLRLWHWIRQAPAGGRGRFGAGTGTERSHCKHTLLTLSHSSLACITHETMGFTCFQL